VGLGLSIVKKIAETYGMQINYFCHDTTHVIKLHYRTK